MELQVLDQINIEFSKTNINVFLRCENGYHVDFSVHNLTVAACKLHGAENKPSGYFSNQALLFSYYVCLTSPCQLHLKMPSVALIRAGVYMYHI